MVIVASFVMLGLIMVLSSSSVTSLHTGSSAWGMFIRQLAWMVLGSIAMWGAYRMPYGVWTQPRLLNLVVLGVVLANLFVALKGAVTNGANAWLDISVFRLQPSEFLKIAMILFAASMLAGRHRAVRIRQVVLYPMYLVIGLPIALCFMQRDFGSAIIFAGIGMGMMFIAGLPKRQLVGTTLIGVALGAVVFQYAGRANDRMMAFLNLEELRDTTGYQVWQALLSIANGGLQGTGIGSGTSKWGYVPLAYSDFIFSVIAEEMGAAGTIMVIGGFIALVLVGMRIAVHAKDMHGAFIAGGIAAWFGVQAIVNIGGVIGMLPMTGLTLPFLSYGGSSLIASMAASGLLLNVAREAKKR
jgi:cell division protein FtsW